MKQKNPETLKLDPFVSYAVPTGGLRVPTQGSIVHQREEYQDYWRVCQGIESSRIHILRFRKRNVKEQLKGADYVIYEQPRSLDEVAV